MIDIISHIFIVAISLLGTVFQEKADFAQGNPFIMKNFVSRTPHNQPWFYQTQLFSSLGLIPRKPVMRGTTNYDIEVCQ